MQPNPVNRGKFNKFDSNAQTNNNAKKKGRKITNPFPTSAQNPFAFGNILNGEINYNDDDNMYFFLLKIREMIITIPQKVQQITTTGIIMMILY